MIKCKLTNINLPAVIHKEEKALEPIETKSSRIWGKDDEFSYAQAANLLSNIGIPQPSKMRTYTDYATQYGNNVWVYAGVYQIAMSAASVGRGIYKKLRSKNSAPVKIEDKNDPLVQVFNRPNPYMTGFDLIEAITTGLELTGNAYLEEVYSRRKVLMELYPLQPHKVEIVPDPTTKIRGYIYKAVQEVYFEESEITHISYYNPLSDFYGLSGVSPAESTINTNNYARQWNKNFFKNSALPVGALETESVLNEDVIKRLKASWKKAHRGVSKAHEIAVLEGGLKWRSIETTRKDMDFSTLGDKDRDEILAALGVYSPLLGIINSSNNSILDNLKKLFWENTMMPKLEKIEAAINMNLIWPNDDTKFFAFDKDSIDALKGSLEVRARIAGMLVDRGIMVVNEARKIYFNLPPQPYGNTWYMPLNLVAVDKAGQGMGTGTGGESGIPGQVIGRPPAKQLENINNSSQTLDGNGVNMFGYDSGIKEE